MLCGQRFWRWDPQASLSQKDMALHCTVLGALLSQR